MVFLFAGMRIKNIEGLSAGDLQEAVKNGGRFVYYGWTLSVVILTFKRTSGVYLVRNARNRWARGIGFAALSFFFGWWGIPSGPKFTFESIRDNLRGGKDVTEDVMSVVAGYVLYEEKYGKKSK